MKKKQSAGLYISFVRMAERIDVWYKGLFWKLKKEEGVFELEARTWAHWVHTIVVFPLGFAIFLLTCITSLLNMDANARKIYIDQKQFDSLDQEKKKITLKAAKRRLLLP